MPSGTSGSNDSDPGSLGWCSRVSEKGKCCSQVMARGLRPRSGDSDRCSPHTVTNYFYTTLLSCGGQACNCIQWKDPLAEVFNLESRNLSCFHPILNERPWTVGKQVIVLDPDDRTQDRSCPGARAPPARLCLLLCEYSLWAVSRKTDMMSSDPRERKLLSLCWPWKWAREDAGPCLLGGTGAHLLRGLRAVGGAGAARGPLLRLSRRRGAAALRRPLGAHGGRAWGARWAAIRGGAGPAGGREPGTGDLRWSGSGDPGCGTPWASGNRAPRHVSAAGPGEGQSPRSPTSYLGAAVATPHPGRGQGLMWAK